MGGAVRTGASDLSINMYLITYPIVKKYTVKSRCNSCSHKVFVCLFVFFIVESFTYVSHEVVSLGEEMDFKLITPR